MSFPLYPKYKDSGVEWLGEVPEHWELRRVRWLCEIKKRIAGELGHDVLSVTQQGLRVKDLDSNDGQLSMDYSKYQLVEVGDFAMNHMDLLTGYVDIAATRGVTSPDYRVFATRDRTRCRDSYLLYLFQMGYRNRIFFAYGQGSSQLGRWRMPTEAFNELRFPQPTPDEQDRIAAFLDQETAKIDELVAEQQRLMDLLKEKRQAVISHAVTKGLNPNAPMKPSGIAWIGDVPSHWEIRRLKHLSPRISGRLVYQPAQYFAAEGVPFLMGNNVTDRGIDWDGVKYIPAEVNDSFAQHALRKGDVITVRVGAPGVTCVVPKEADGLNCGSLMIIRRSPSFDSQWLSSVMNSAVITIQIAAVQYGAAQEQINITDAVNFQVPTPPNEEQRQIVSFLGRKLGEFDLLTAESQRAIDLLQERRAALISAAVTGQIDVRGFVARRVA